jgi:DNA mismatch repair protein MutS2
VAEVVAVGDKLTVQVGALSTRVAATAVERIGGPIRQAAPRRGKKPKRKHVPVTLGDALRTPANTVSLRGLRIDDAEAAVDAFLDKASMSGWDVVFVLHGHGTGALKTAVRREWLRQSAYVTQFAPANEDQGGDAYTVAALR